MPKTRAKPADKIYQIKVALRHSSLPIWRRVQVRSDTTLRRLHQILQVVMGWEGEHLHQFSIRGVLYSDRGDQFDLEIRDEARARLGEVVPRVKSKFLYEYDFGDGWGHEIQVEKILPAQEGTRYPVCLAGERACPPEDCGGIGGYDRLLEAIQDPNHPEHDERLEWLGEDFDPEAFHLEAINRALR